MAIVISGVNNNDRITASDGTIDLLSGVNYAGIITAPAFTTPGNFTAGHLNIGSGIQLGNAGVAPATTFVGNLTGNVNATSNLLLQIGGSEKFRVGSSGQLGIGGANYGTSGQVLTSGGSGSAATWSTINSDAINEGNTKAEVVDTGSDGHFKVETEGNERLRIASNGDFGFNDTSPTANASGNDTVLSIKGKGSSYSGKIDFKDSSGNIDNHIASDNAIFMFNCDPNSDNGNTFMQFSVHGGERFRFGRHGQLGIAGANYGTSGQVLTSGGTTGVPTWTTVAAGGASNISFNSGNGIDFSATADGTGSSSRSELLDDYESGEWTGSINSGSANINNPWYVKIGKLVIGGGSITAISDTSSSNAIVVNGLPFSNSGGNSGRGSVSASKNNQFDKMCDCYVSGTTVRFMVSSLSTGSWDYLRHSSVVQSSGSITFAFNYQTA